MKSPEIYETPDSTLVYIPGLEEDESYPNELFIGSIDERPILKKADVAHVTNLLPYGNLFQTNLGNIYLPHELSEEESPRLLDLHGEHPLRGWKLGAFTVSNCGANVQIVK
jgi:hypothetical protein